MVEEARALGIATSITGCVLMGGQAYELSGLPRLRIASFNEQIALL